MAQTTTTKSNTAGNTATKTDSAANQKPSASSGASSYKTEQKGSASSGGYDPAILRLIDYVRENNDVKKVVTSYKFDKNDPIGYNHLLICCNETPLVKESFQKYLTNDTYDVFERCSLQGERAASGYAKTQEIIGRLPDVPVKWVENYDWRTDSYFDGTTDPLTHGKKRLYLKLYKGAPVKACPAFTEKAVCCNYHIVDFVENCPFECVYCILQAIQNRPLITVHVNAEEMIGQIAEIITKHPQKNFRIGTGEFSDSLATDHILNINPFLVEVFGKLPNALLELKTKSDHVQPLIGLRHNGQTVVSWSVGTEEMAKAVEYKTALPSARVAAASVLAKDGYHIAFHLDPIIVQNDAESRYLNLMENIAKSVPAEKIAWFSMGSLRFIPKLKAVAEKRFPKTDIFASDFVQDDEKTRYFRPVREKLYKTEVRDCISELSESIFGNPSSLHSIGRRSSVLLNKSRREIADILCVKPDAVIFTSGASESNNLVLRSVIQSHSADNKLPHIITSPAEHPSILKTLRLLVSHRAIELTVVPVDRCGRVDPESVKTAFTPNTALVTICAVAPEIGTIQPLEHISAICKNAGILFHSDFSQGVRSQAYPFMNMCDFFTVSAHKIYGMRGIGLLVKNTDYPLSALITGGDQEFGVRAGTENTILAVALSTALACLQNDKEEQKTGLLMQSLHQLITENSNRFVLTGHPSDRAYFHLSYTVKDVSAEKLLIALDMQNVCASSGSACSVGNREASEIMLALNTPPELTMNTLRLTSGRYNTPDEIQTAAKIITNTAEKLSVKS
ncbi:hypothetical protein CHS0354_006894 [Potamilus streckersoni]|uniref:Aminotransferase class V domain-containing protein n=1 Tax=Potamilus streckersoni TaxID=2493646 RepID=A0AAE0TFA8_9BIVA|nr:hypothetical protein CHS0354_006894 [Potamilus streckersoni]